MRICPHRFMAATDQDVAVFTTLGRMLARWRDDPERLAVAIYAYENLLGYADAAFEMEYNHPDVPSISRDKALRLREQALYRRNRHVLKNRAEGLVLALRATAEAAEAWRLHGVQLESAVIECRRLPTEERLNKLRTMAADR